MLTVCVFKWHKPGYRSKFEAEHVLIMRNMVARHYQKPHRFVCITDDATGLDEVETIPLWDDHKDVPSPHGRGNPSCYRRLRLFAKDAADIVGPRFVAVDLDTVIVGDMSPIWDRNEDFIIWGETNPKSFYNGSMWEMTAGARSQVWEKFDPVESPRMALKAGRFGSDQGWISHVLGPQEATWGRQDGVYSFRVHIYPVAGQKLPSNAKIVMFHGKTDPSSYDAQKIGWVRENYR